MKNLETLNVQEINATELVNIDGGKAPEWLHGYLIYHKLWDFFT